MTSRHAKHTELAGTTPDSIDIRGKDLVNELMGKLTFTEMFLFHLLGQPATALQVKITDGVLVAIMEHGLVPSVIASRLTLLGAPESYQGAIAAGLLGVGDRFAGTTGLSLTVPIAAATAALPGIAQATGHLTAGVLAAAAGLAPLLPVLPYAFEMLALRRMRPAAFGTLMALEPAIGVLLACSCCTSSPRPTSSPASCSSFSPAPPSAAADAARPRPNTPTPLALAAESISA